MEQFTFFWSGPFSQWHPSPFTIEGTAYNRAEQWMMAAKARMFEGQEQFVKDEAGNLVLDDHGEPARTTLGKIMASNNPFVQKKLGKEVKNFDNLKWQAIAKIVVYNGNYAKFTQNEDLKEQLLTTKGTTLVEASPKDAVWGIGLAENHPDAKVRSKWRGKNWLGEVLTDLRDDLLRIHDNHF